MSTNQPVWKLVANLGDVNPIDHGGCFLFVDETGVYPPELENWDRVSDDDDAPIGVHRAVLDQCTFIDGILSYNRFHPGLKAWRADDIASIASTNGSDAGELIRLFCSSNPMDLASAYIELANHNGWHALDNYPETMTPAEAAKRLASLNEINR